MVGKMIVARSSQSGVWFGQCESIDGDTVTMTNARRAWQWTGALSCSDLATRGPSGGKISAPVDRVTVFGVCEIIEASVAAIDQWATISDWTP